VHINRLKRAHVQEPEISTSTPKIRVSQKRKKSKSDRKEEDSNQEIPPVVRTRASVDDGDSEDSDDMESLTADHMSPVIQGQDSPQRKPGSLHSRRKSSNDNSSKEIAYQLRTRTVYGPEQEAPCITGQDITSEAATVVHTTPHSRTDDQIMLETAHPYNLRKRV
jgi:hypothetical protein